MRLERTPVGLVVRGTKIVVDPIAPVEDGWTAIATHAHVGIDRTGGSAVHCTPETAALLADAPGPPSWAARLVAVPYGDAIHAEGATVTLLPSGHIRGAAQVRVESAGGVLVVAGEFKRAPDPTAAPFEGHACDELVIDATYGLPIFRWPNPGHVIDAMLELYETERARGSPVIVFLDPIGKAARLLAELARRTDLTVQIHPAMKPAVDVARRGGVTLLPTVGLATQARAAGEPPLVLAPPEARGSPLLARLRKARTLFASGDVLVRGPRRRLAVDRGIVLSDLADFDDLVETVTAVGARQVGVDGRHAAAFSRWLTERGMAAVVVPRSGA